MATASTATDHPNRFRSFTGNPDFVLSLARGLQVIESFQRMSEALSVSAIASRTRLSRAAVRRLLITLEMLGYASHERSLYRLSPRVLQLGFSYLSSSSLESLASPLLQHITQLLHESCSLGVLEGNEVIYVARSAAQRVMSIGLAVGSRLPAFCTAMGRVMLAALTPRELSAFLRHGTFEPLTPRTVVDKTRLNRLIDRIRMDGYSIVDGELEIGLRSIAVPVTSRSGRVVAAINSGVHASRVTKQNLTTEFLPVLRQQASLLGSMLA